MEEWFAINQIDDSTYIISEYRHWEETHCYLLNGTKYSLLIDTGLDICNIYDEVQRLTGKTRTMPHQASPYHVKLTKCKRCPNPIAKLYNAASGIPVLHQAHTIL